ncbi:MAG: Stp1/IreP family PP2C-type Ser/Thr phosphatase [Bacilli bacterium]|nr:Stp1/IreP family PP2C-type Ser/Thr phosphatase [Bacilli bacterium]
MGRIYKGLFSSATDIGKIRISNEDRAAVLTNYCGDVFLIICDGMGGQNKGDYASKMAIDSLTESFRKKRKTPFLLTKFWLKRALSHANSIIFEEATTKPLYTGMGTTCVAVYIQGEKMAIANIGDSRAYSYAFGRLKRLTTDQTYVDYLYRTGKIKSEERDTSPDRHVLMNALGIYPSCSPDIHGQPYNGEAILCCSDGLYNNVSESEIRAVLSTDDRPDQKVMSLIAEANGNGGSDNIGIAYWEAVNHD